MKSETDFWGHRSCVSAKVVGPTYGVAKKAKVVMVKLGALSASIFPSYMLKATALMIEDIKKRHLQRKAVINVSWSWLIEAQLKNERLSTLKVSPH